MRPAVTPPGVGYKWVALSNTTLGVLMAMINSSIVLIAMPDIFRGIHLNPLLPQNASYLLWMMMGYMVVTAVLVVTLGRLGDMYGRVRMYNLGFVVFTVGSILLWLTWSQGTAGALELIGFRVVQGVGGALLMANSAAILTDAFPTNERGMVLGINSVAAIAGSFLGLVIGGLVASTDWRLVFLVSVPFGLFGTVWAYLKLREISPPHPARLDWGGNLTFGLGLILILVGITYGIQPSGGHAMGWTSVPVLGELAAGLTLLGLFVVIERRVSDPLFHLTLFRIRAFSAGNLAGFLAAIGRGGLMFMLIIWLQGIWLPLHGFSFAVTPLWAAVYMLPLTWGFLVAGPISGILSDRFGARPFATVGMLAAAATFGLLMTLPANFSYWPFAALLFANGLSMGLFSAPNTAAIMNSVPAAERGAASGMRATFQNTGMTLSIGLFFSLMIVGLSASLPHTLVDGLTRAGLPVAAADRVARLPAVSTLFAAFLGDNPMKILLGPQLAHLSPAAARYLVGRSFFPDLISRPFIHGMRLAFLFAAGMTLFAAVASWMRGGRYVPEEQGIRAVGSETAVWAPVVTISAEYGTEGSVVAPQVAAALGVPFLDRAISVESAEAVAQALGTAELKAARNRSEIGRVFAASARLLALSGMDAPNTTRLDDPGERLRAASEAVIRHVAMTTGGVILGRGGALVLRDWPTALHVRLTAPQPERLRYAMKRREQDELSTYQQMKASDRARLAYVQYFYQADARDPRHYHLVLNAARVPADVAVGIIVAAARQWLERARTDGGARSPAD